MTADVWNADEQAHRAEGDQNVSSPAAGADLEALRQFGVDEALLTVLEDASRHAPLVVKTAAGSSSFKPVAAALDRQAAVYVERRRLIVALDPQDGREIELTDGLRVVEANGSTWRISVPFSVVANGDVRAVAVDAVVRALKRSQGRTPVAAVSLSEDPDAEDLAAPTVGRIDVPAVLFNIAREWQPGMDEDAVYDVTHGWWRMGLKRERAEYALAVAQGQVRAVFRVLGWTPRREGDANWEHDAPGKPRWGFDGEPDPDMSHLVGLDVRDLFPPGAANPVRYVNCDEAVPASVAHRYTSAVPDATAAESLREVCARLHANPVLHMSLHSKELFHSNLLGWIVEAHPDLGAAALSPWLQPDRGQERLRVRREHHQLDLIVELPGYRALVVENKVFSLPDEQQLARYDEKNIVEAGLADASRVLLSLPDPGWQIWRSWTWISYEALVERLAAIVEPLRVRDGFAAELLERYLAMVNDLLQVVALTQIADDAEPVALDVDRLELLRPVRLHDVMQKLRARHLMRRLEELYQHDGLTYAWTQVDLSNGAVLMTTAVQLPGGDQVGWQLQGAQWRRFLKAAQLQGRGPAAKDARSVYAEAGHTRWFTFAKEQELGPFQEMRRTGFNHYDPDFVYRYVKTPGLTVSELVIMATSVVEEALAYAAEQT